MAGIGFKIHWVRILLSNPVTTWNCVVASLLIISTLVMLCQREGFGGTDPDITRILWSTLTTKLYVRWLKLIIAYSLRWMCVHGMPCALEFNGISYLNALSWWRYTEVLFIQCLRWICVHVCGALRIQWCFSFFFPLSWRPVLLSCSVMKEWSIIAERCFSCNY